MRVTHFTLYRIYNFSILLLYYYISGLFLSTKYIGLHSVVDILVDFEPMYPGFKSRESHEFFFLLLFFLKFFMFFLSLLLQCKFAKSTLLSLPRFSYFITTYDAQASSAFSALIISFMNAKSNIFTSGFANREKNYFWCSFGEIKIDLTLKKSNILYMYF